MFTEDLKHVALRLLKALNVPEGEVVKDHIIHRRWDQLIKIKFDPLQHSHKSVDEFRRICLAQEFLRKAEFLDTTIDKSLVAREGFLSCERQCASTNRRLAVYLDHPVFQTAVEVRFAELLDRARAWLKGTLGPLPDFLNGRFGPGAVFESSSWRRVGGFTAYDKLRKMPCKSHNLSEALVDHLVWETAFAPAWADACPTRRFAESRGNRFTTVPKDSSKDRGIAIEPGINLLGQLAVGDFLKLRLKRRGIDLRGTEDRVHPVLSKLGLAYGRPWKGQLLHQKYARDSSLSGSHATIDLSNASDTVSYNLVKLLLPDVWFDLLSELRSPLTRFSPSGKERDARWYRLEKFSSMGNGFTFELETLIFCALAHSLGAKIGLDTFVYGDDIIVPDHLAPDLLALLQFVGLTPNEKKTFFGEVPFRESCGGDFFLGHDVRPFYWKESPNDPAAWINIANNLRTWSIKWSMPELMAVRASALDRIPTAVRRCRGPQELGDLCIHDDVEKWSTKQRGSIRYVRVWRPVIKKRYLRTVSRKAQVYSAHPPTRRETSRRVRELVEQGVSLSAALIGLPSDGIAPRDSLDLSVSTNGVAGYRFGFVAFS